MGKSDFCEKSGEKIDVLKVDKERRTTSHFVLKMIEKL